MRIIVIIAFCIAVVASSNAEACHYGGWHGGWHHGWAHHGWHGGWHHHGWW